MSPFKKRAKQEIQDKRDSKESNKQQKRDSKEVNLQKRDSKFQEKNDISTKSNVHLVIKWGKPVLHTTHHAVSFMYSAVMLLLLGCIVYGLDVILTAIKIRYHLGYFLNLVSRGDGEYLPTMQCLPVLIFIILNVFELFFVFQVYDPNENKLKYNRALFIVICVQFIFLIVLFILLFVIMGHILGSHERIHNGITAAMKKYSKNSKVKAELDMLQIEFNCCGSKNYDEWYNITWFDKKFLQKGTEDHTKGNTPFSCCSMRTLNPCIHHDIESTGKTYLYTPERNLSISTKGCFDSLKNTKRKVGWEVIGRLFLFLILEILIIICARFLQTAHFEQTFIEGSNVKQYTMWLFGQYTGKVMVSPDAPELPPIPNELMK